MPQNNSVQGREYFAASVRPSSASDADRTIDCVFFTGIDVPRTGYNGPYIRRFDKAGCDLSLLNSQAPIFDNHDSDRGAAGQLGVVRRAWIDGDNYLATLQFSMRTSLDDIWRDLKDGIISKFSMGTEILSEREISGPPVVRLADRWRPFEISLAPLPADFGTTTLSSDHNVQPWQRSSEPWAVACRRRDEEIESLLMSESCRARAREIAVLRLK